MPDKPIDMESLFHEAKQILPSDIFSFFNAYSSSGIARNRNSTIFSDILILPKVLRAIKKVSIETHTKHFNLKTPILIAPTAYNKLLSEDGELDMLRAANKFGNIYIASMFSSSDFKLLAKEAKVPIWLQMYLLKDRTINKNLLNLAETTGYKAIVVTVDTPIYAKKSGMQNFALNNLSDGYFEHLKNIGIPVKQCISSREHFSQLLDSNIGWKDIEWVINNTKLPIILKGIMHPQDTAISIKYPQIQGIVVSNHGGRQLNSTFSAVELLQQHKQIIKDKPVTLFVDGGFSRGEDIFKALALGANGVLIGKTLLWSLALGKSYKMVSYTLETLQEELIETMYLAGCSSIDEISTTMLNIKSNFNINLNCEK